MNELLEKNNLIYKQAFPRKFLTYLHYRKQDMKKPYLHFHWQPFLPPQWQKFPTLSARENTKSLTDIQKAKPLPAI
ncbi:TPA: hypothetical protein ACFRHF_002181 [Neisseria lactamica]|uniref:hypothetical protein n=1 Tax=Neisseria lactamica TaxID=486 RepID=UPI0015F107EF|nr:hypothetical protein [Neisseria lactamica]